MVGEVFIFWSKSHVSLLFTFSDLVFFLFFFILIADLFFANLTFCPSFYILQNFKREEQNFVVMNEINNMSFLTADSKSKMSKVRVKKEANGQVKHSPLNNLMFYSLHISSCNSFKTKL